MNDVTIYHNPRCSKSRQALALLEEAGRTPTVVKYLDDPSGNAPLSDDAAIAPAARDPWSPI